MRLRRASAGAGRIGGLAVVAASLAIGVAPAPAGASVGHVVLAGETLSGIAAANGLATETLAGFNGVAADAWVYEGQTIQVPSADEAAGVATTSSSTTSPPASTAVYGLATISGRKSDPPTLVGSAIVDQHAAVLGALGVLAALYERRDTGKGKRVDSNLLNSALDLQIEPFIYHLNGQLYDRSDAGVSSRFHQAPYGIFETADGYICISLTPPEKMAEAFGDDTFYEWTEEDQFRRREEVNAHIAGHVRTRPAEHCRASR